MQTRCLGGFFVMWVTKLLISPVKIRIFCPKKSKFGPKMAFGILGQALPANLVWWFWCVGCISQDTYLLYKHYSIFYNTSARILSHCDELHKIIFWETHMLGTREDLSSPYCLIIRHKILRGLWNRASTLTIHHSEQCSSVSRPSMKIVHCTYDKVAVNSKQLAILDEISQ